MRGDLNSVSEFHTSDQLWQLVVAIEAVPAFLRGLEELVWRTPQWLSRAVIDRPMNRRKPGHSFTPMTLGNMRELGVRSLAVTCEICHHEAVLPADRWPDEVLVSTFRPRMACTCCGIVGADTRPNWREMRASGNWQVPEKLRPPVGG